MMTIRRLPDRSPQRRRRSFACGYTLLEFIVAMTVLGIALSGLFPLTAILSRHLQPVKTPTSGGYDCRTPARDGNTTGNVAYSQHTWYLAPYAGPWARKLGASAQLLSALPGGSPPPGFAQTNSPVPVPPPVVSLDDYEPNGSPSSNPNDGSGTFACSGSGWQYVPSSGQPSFGDGGDYHSHLVPIDQNDSSLSDTASWQITVPADGWYTVQATWPATSDTTLPLAGAAYQVAITPARPVTLLSTTQTSPGPANGVTDANGTSWWPLTTPTQLTKNDVVTVTLGVPRNVTTPGLYVIADAVRIVQNEVKIESLERSLVGANGNSVGADVTAHVSVTVNLAQ